VPQAICVGTFHAYREVSRAYYYGKPIFRRFFKRLDGHITVSEAARQYHMRYFPADYAVIPNGVDVDLFGCSDVRPMEEYQDGYLNVLFVGRLEKRKGLPYLIEALPQVQRDVPNVRLMVVGAYDEAEQTPFLLQAHSLGLNHVHFVGRVTEEELARYYRTADVFCAPNTGMESFGLVLLEAMASGIPIVASDIEGYHEVVDDGVQGVLVRPEDPEALACERAFKRWRERRDSQRIKTESPGVAFRLGADMEHPIDRACGNRAGPPGLDAQHADTRRPGFDYRHSGRDRAGPFVLGRRAVHPVGHL
jgi:phosphatidylinositol alpha-mannosyltransferase